MIKLNTTDGHTKYVFANDVKTVTGIGSGGGGFSEDHKSSVRMRDGELILCRDDAPSIVSAIRAA